MAKLKYMITLRLIKRWSEHGEPKIVLTNKTPLREKEISQLPDLKYIGVLATGYNVVDIEAARKRNIVVTNVPAYGTKSVAQMTFALLLELTQHVQRHSDAVFNGEWTRSRDFCFWKYPLVELGRKDYGHYRVRTDRSGSG